MIQDPESDNRLQRLLQGSWAINARKNRLQRTLIFRDFAQAFDFMARVAQVAERLDHHPDWCNSYNRVEVCLSTHATGTLTHRDIELAEAIEQIVADLDSID